MCPSCLNTSTSNLGIFFKGQVYGLRRVAYNIIEPCAFVHMGPKNISDATT